MNDGHFHLTLPKKFKYQAQKMRLILAQGLLSKVKIRGAGS